MTVEVPFSVEALVMHCSCGWSESANPEALAVMKSIDDVKKYLDGHRIVCPQCSSGTMEASVKIPLGSKGRA